MRKIFLNSLCIIFLLVSCEKKEIEPCMYKTYQETLTNYEVVIKKDKDTKLYYVVGTKNNTKYPEHKFTLCKKPSFYRRHIDKKIIINAEIYFNYVYAFDFIPSDDLMVITDINP